MKKGAKMTRHVHYLCDPAKNTACTKRECFIKGGDCYKTANREFAQAYVQVIETVRDPNPSIMFVDKVHFEPLYPERKLHGTKPRI